MAGIRIVRQDPSLPDQLAYSIEDNGLEQGFLRCEMPVDRPGTNAGATGYFVERHIRAFRAKSGAGRRQHAVSVPPRVGTSRTNLTGIEARWPGAGRRGVASSHQTNLPAP